MQQPFRQGHAGLLAHRTLSLDEYVIVRDSWRVIA